MRSRGPHWRRTVTLPLPGDADTVLEAETARAVRRDGRLTSDEHHAVAVAGACSFCRQKYRSWTCTYEDPCFYCESLGIDGDNSI